jgi:hypothetical protein
MSETSAAPARQRAFLLDGLHAPQRWLLAAAALVAAGAHVPVIGPHLDEAPYMGVLFVVLTVGCTAIGLAAVVRDSRAVYALAILTCGLAVLGYVATRLIAFPMLADDVGNWLEPLGIASVLSEGTVVVAALRAMSRRRGRAGDGKGPIITVSKNKEAACTR